MVDMSALGSALASLTAAKDIAQAMMQLRDDAAFQAKLIEFQSKILDAQNDALAAHDERSGLIDKIRRLEGELAAFKAWEDQKQRYVLEEISSGAFAYALRPEEPASEPMHWICPTCYERRERIILQRAYRSPARVRTLFCHACKTTLYVALSSLSEDHAGTQPASGIF